MPPQIFILRMRPVPPGHEGKPGDWDRVPEALEENHLIIGWAEADGLLHPELSWEVFRGIVENAYGGIYDRRRAGAAAGQAWRFIRGMNLGDLVVVPDGERFHIGRVAGEPWFDENGVESNSAYRRDAEWLRLNVPRASAGPALLAALNRRLTLSLVGEEGVAKEIGELLAIRPNNENLRQRAAPVLAQWLIREARRGSSITYGQAARRLEGEIGFNNIFPLSRMGIPAGHLMDRILEVSPDCPLLNVLLVRQEGRVPSDGAGGYMAAYLEQPELGEPGYLDDHPAEWRAASEAVAADVYAFAEWDQVYEQAFGHPLPPAADPEGQDGDGIAHGRHGEGPNHEELRLWVLNNPGAINPAYENFRAETEVVLDSADRVDVVFFGPNGTVALEVKSSDSNETDLRRGVFQCIKYRAVMEAMDIRSEFTVAAILVTQEDLPGDLAALARLNGVRHIRTLGPRQAA